jgi:hypothetical protein
MWAWLRRRNLKSTDFVECLVTFADGWSRDICHRLEPEKGVISEDVRELIATEFIWFAIHMLSREAHEKVGAERRSCIIDSIVSCMVLRSCSELDDAQEPETVLSVLLNILDETECLYSACPELLSEGKILSGSGLFDVATSRILGLVGNIENPITIKGVQHSLVNAWSVLDMRKWVKIINKNCPRV